MITADATAAMDAALVAPGAESRAPGLLSALKALDGAIDAGLMRAANAHVDLDGGTVSEAADTLAAEID